MTGKAFALLPEAEAIITGDLERSLPSEAREVLLDVILAWANLDLATAFFVASVSGLNPDAGADRFGRKEIAEKLKRAVKALDERGEADVAARVREIADAYPDKSLLRRRIAHSKCAGVRKSLPSRFVFLPYEREGPAGHLAIEIIDMSQFIDAANWATEVHDYFIAYTDSAEFFDPPCD